MNNLFNELKRRNIFRVAAVYAVIGWALAQMASLLEQAMNMPGWFDAMVVNSRRLGLSKAARYHRLCNVSSRSISSAVGSNTDS